MTLRHHVVLEHVMYIHRLIDIRSFPNRPHYDQQHNKRIVFSFLSHQFLNLVSPLRCLRRLVFFFSRPAITRRLAIVLIVSSLSTSSSLSSRHRLVSSSHHRLNRLFLVTGPRSGELQQVGDITWRGPICMMRAGMNLIQHRKRR